MNINLLAPVNSLGYGVAGKNIMKALVKNQGHDVALFPINLAYEYDREFDPIYQAGIARAFWYDDAAPSVRMYHQDQLAEHVGRGMRVGFPFFELDRFTLAEANHLDRMDRIFVASQWARQVVLEETSMTGRDVHVVPLGVDRTVFHDGLRQSPRPDDDVTKFINVGKWEVRKGHDILLSAFNKAFKPGDRVHLHMVCHNPFLGAGNAAWVNAYKSSPMGGHIRVEKDRLESLHHLARLMAGSDCGVWPARAEGWNLEPLEMLATGGHVIATNYAGHTEYMNGEQGGPSLPLEPVGMEDAYDGVWFHGEGQWAKIDEDELIEALRSVHRRKQTGCLGVNTTGIHVSEKFGWAQSAERFTAGLTS